MATLWTSGHEKRLTRFLAALIDQEAARVAVPPREDAPGFWFGGGNLVQDAAGTLWLVGRYRNAGDSRTGTAAGARGLELALFKSTDQGATFEKARSWSKQDLSRPGQPVLSIEGASLLLRDDGVELYVSTEKQESYPADFADFQKPGTGVWSIDVFTGTTPETLDAATLAPVFHDAPAPEYLHVKDPVAYTTADGGTTLLFCNHPITWSSSNTGLARRAPGGTAFTAEHWELVRRGPAWDVAGTRLTARLPVPAVGAFAGLPPLTIYLYDGLECVREHAQSATGVRRPRGYSCEELGGALYGFDAEFPALARLSRIQPLFVSPHGTGCSRYVETLVAEDGIRATWQQAQPSGAQPLVTHFLPNARIAELLD